MKKWYRSPVTKLLLVLTACASAVGLVISFVMLLCISSLVSSGDIFEETKKNYEDTNRFVEQMGTDSHEILRYLDTQSQFETEGEYNPDKIVDIVAYANDGIISGVNESGLAYRLGDLVEWSRQYNAESNGYEARGIVVCKKVDGTYSYYYINDFRQAIFTGEVNLYMGETRVPKFSILEEEFLRELENGEFELDLFPKQYDYTMTDETGQTEEDSLLEETRKIVVSGQLNLRDSDNNIRYVDCWVMDKHITELYPPIGAESMLQAVENSPELNGNLSEADDMLLSSLNTIYSDVKTYQDNEKEWTEENSNFYYLFVDHTSRQLFSNISSYTEYARTEEYISSIQERDNCKYIIVRPERRECESNIEQIYSRSWIQLVENYQSMTKDYTFVVMVDTSYPVADDSFALAAKDYEKWAPYQGTYAGLTASFAILFVASFLWLTMIAGRKETDEEIHLNTFDGWKTELGAAAVIILWVLATCFMLATVELWHISSYSEYGLTYSGAGVLAIRSLAALYWTDILAIGIYVILTVSLFLAGYLSLVRRIKGKTLWKNSLLRLILNGGKHIAMTFWGQRKLTTRAVMVVVGFILLHWFLAFCVSKSGLRGFVLSVCMLLVAVADVAAVYLTARNMIARQRIKEGVAEIAAGKVDFKISTENLNGTEREVAEQLNNIGGGLQQAVETAVKSERLKTDLITNVSHDIKTPLTSIINYVDLLKRENFDDPKIRGYLDILDAKSQRLKTLTEDVVEASKVSSGNISLEYMNVNLVEMLNQTIGETSEKMEKRNLRVIASFPEEPVIIRVDGRRMWRVLENIFNNAAKYAMPGTRIYADLHTVNGKAVFSLKNVSEQPLNIKAEELTERFIRGDVARSSEGSGLGLSIAKSLTQLQGGTFELYLDGDLFKVIITFDEKSKVE